MVDHCWLCAAYRLAPVQSIKLLCISIFFCTSARLLLSSVPSRVVSTVSSNERTNKRKNKINAWWWYNACRGGKYIMSLSVCLSDCLSVCCLFVYSILRQPTGYSLLDEFHDDPEIGRAEVQTYCQVTIWQLGCNVHDLMISLLFSLELLGK